MHVVPRCRSAAEGTKSSASHMDAFHKGHPVFIANPSGGSPTILFYTQAEPADQLYTQAEPDDQQTSARAKNSHRQSESIADALTQFGARPFQGWGTDSGTVQS